MKQKYKFYVKYSFHEDSETYDYIDILYFHGHNYKEARYHAKCYVTNKYREFKKDPVFRFYRIVSKKEAERLI